MRCAGAAGLRVACSEAAPSAQQQAAALQNTPATGHTISIEFHVGSKCMGTVSARALCRKDYCMAALLTTLHLTDQPEPGVSKPQHAPLNPSINCADGLTFSCNRDPQHVAIPWAQCTAVVVAARWYTNSLTLTKEQAAACWMPQQTPPRCLRSKWSIVSSSSALCQASAQDLCGCVRHRWRVGFFDCTWTATAGVLENLLQHVKGSCQPQLHDSMGAQCVALVALDLEGNRAGLRAPEPIGRAPASLASGNAHQHA
jgi:hypothetical protein